MPNELLREVLTNLPFEDQRIYRRVSRRFESLCENKTGLTGAELDVVERQAYLRSIQGGSVVQDVDNAKIGVDCAIVQYRIDAFYRGVFDRKKSYCLDPSFREIIRLFPVGSFFNLPLMNWATINKSGGGGTGYIDNLNPKTDFSAPLMRGYDQYGRRPFVAALVLIDTTASSIGKSPCKEKYISQIVLFRRYSWEEKMPIPTLWMSQIIGPKALGQASLISLYLHAERRVLKEGPIDFYHFEEPVYRSSLKLLFSGGVVTEADGTTVRMLHSMAEIEQHQVENCM